MIIKFPNNNSLYLYYILYFSRSFYCPILSFFIQFSFFTKEEIDIQREQMMSKATQLMTYRASTQALILESTTPDSEAYSNADTELFITHYVICKLRYSFALIIMHNTYK